MRRRGALLVVGAADDTSFASAVLFEGGSYAHLFNTPGHYRYLCPLHLGAGMWAEVDVV